MRVQNERVIGAFLRREKATSGARDIVDGYYMRKGASISTDGDKLWSYWTVLAEWDGAKVLVNNKKYSNTTTMQQHDLAVMLDRAGVESGELKSE